MQNKASGKGCFATGRRAGWSAAIWKSLFEKAIAMQPNRAATSKLPWRGWLLGLAGVLGVAASSPASSGEVRHVQVQSVLGQMYDAVIDADDTATFGLSIPRGTALPRRMYPVRNLGMPMIHKRAEPVYLDVLLRNPQRNYTEYLDPNASGNQVTNSPPVVGTPFLTPQFTPAGSIQLSWSASAADWALEETAVLGPGGPASWNLVPSALYQINGDTVFYEEPLVTRGSKFFRLRKL